MITTKKSKKIIDVIRGDFGWDDVGNWTSIDRLYEKMIIAMS
ncbi:hypothetical protein [Thermoanaerobacter ethanolicus]